MASSGGNVPAERAAAAVNDLVEARDGAARLRSFLLKLGDHQRAPWAEQVVDGVLSRLSSAMSALDVSGAVAGGRSPGAGSDSARQQQSVGSSGNTRKRSFSRRSQRSSEQKITATLDDGHVWRKYGQKEIQNSPHPRSYYRCTHKLDQGCNAKRQVQLCEADPSKYVVTYCDDHTCRDPSTIPLIVPAAAGAAAEYADNLIIPAAAGAAADHADNLISFAPSSSNAGGGASSRMAMGGSNTDQLSTSWCTSDDVFSSSAGSFMPVDELIGAVVGSAGVTSSTTVGLVTDCGGQGGVAGGGGTGTGSFPPCPSSLGFVVGSLGSIGDDDDLFRLDT